MSKFLDELKQDIINALDFADGSELDEDVVSMVFARDNNQLGENARKMLEIGIVQDQLAELGFEHEVYSVEFDIFKLDRMKLSLPKGRKRYWLEIIFTKDYVYIAQADERLFFTSPTWQQDLLTKVKELIGDEK